MILPRQVLKIAAAEIALRHNLTLDDVMSQKRRRDICRARNEVFHHLWDHHGKTVCEIARFIGRDHSTVANGIGRHIIVSGLPANRMSRQVLRRDAAAAARLKKRAAKP